MSTAKKTNALFAAFKTNDTLETNGITLQYPGFKLNIARAGGANKAFGRQLDARLKPYDRLMKSGAMDDKVAGQIMAEVYADAIVIKGSCHAEDDKGKWVPNTCPNAKGEIVEATRDNLVQLFTDLPELFRDIQTQAGNFALFREADLDETAKN